MSRSCDECELLFGERSYRLEIVDLAEGERFWTVGGSKKGGQHTGGGIPIGSIQTLHGICRLLNTISSLDVHKGHSETKVVSFSSRNRMYCGETRQFGERWFYRIKSYANFFVRKGAPHFYANHLLKPSGRGYYIQEFDFPITTEGVAEASAFSNCLRDTIENHLATSIERLPGDKRQLIRDQQVVVGRELPWLNTVSNDDPVYLGKPLIDILCDRLREEPLTSNKLAMEFGIAPQVAESHVHPSARYDPRYLSRGFLLDRVRGELNSWNYLITQIPKDALNESPTLIPLFVRTPPGNWSAWKKATFSNDEYSTGRAQSIHFAKFEIEALEGGIDWGGSLPTLLSYGQSLSDYSTSLATIGATKITKRQLILSYIAMLHWLR